MQFFYTDRFLRSYADAPRNVQRQCDKQLLLLARDIRHPSVRAKKYDERRGVWQGRVNLSWRFYFLIEADGYRFIDIMAHPK